MRVGGLLVVLLTTAPVIAAPHAIDHRDPTPATPFWPTALLLAVALLSAALILWRGWQRLAASPPRIVLVRPELLIVGAFLMLGLAAVGVKIAQMFFGAPLFSPDAPIVLGDQARLGIAAYAAQTLVALAYLRILAVATPPDPDLRVRPLRAALCGVGGLALCWPLVGATSWAVAAARVAFGAEPPDPIAHDTLALLHESPVDAWYLLLVAQVVVVAPVLEELLYRGFAQEALRRLGVGPWPAIAVTSVLFTVMHVGIADLHAVAGLYVLSLAFGWMYERTGRLLAPIVMHVGFNAGNLVLAGMV